MTKRFSQKNEDDWEILDRTHHFAYAHSGYQASKIIDELNELVDTNRELYRENEQLKQTIDELTDYREKGLEMEYINDIYKEDGFKGVIEYAKNQLSRYGAVREVDKGLWLLATGGWSDHESWLDCLLSWNFLYARGHYRATTSGGGYYYSETPYAHIEIKLEDNVQH